METKHTPGPWKVRFMNPDEPNESDFFVEATNNNMPDIGYGIEILQDDYGTHNGYTHEQRLADAKLIAAAPDQNEALISLPDPYNYSTMKEWLVEYDKWNETKRKPAIKKATE